MPLEFTTSYLTDSLSLFRHYKKLGEGAIAQCTDEQLLAEVSAGSNSVATLVKHIAGNQRSRWTDFLTSDGEKPDRDRDSEFEAPPQDRKALLALWESGWAALFSALEPLGEADLAKTVTIRGERHSVMQAINRQVAHYSYHVGQLVFLAKQLAGEKWKSLSIPRRQSAQFNAAVAAGEKSQR